MELVDTATQLDYTDYQIITQGKNLQVVIDDKNTWIDWLKSHIFACLYFDPHQKSFVTMELNEGVEVDPVKVALVQEDEKFFADWVYPNLDQLAVEGELDSEAPTTIVLELDESPSSHS